MVWICFQALSFPVQGRTWNVEKDGSGDFTVIQDALDAATSGDTLRIGPGRFEDFREYQTNGGLRIYIAKIEVPEMVIIGAGRDQTILGPSEYTWDGEEPIPRGVVCISQQAPGGLSLSGVTFENLYSGVYVENAVGLTVEDCGFVGGDTGVRSFEQSMVKRCQFSGMRIGVWVDGPADSGLVENCQFFNCKCGVLFQWMGNGFVRGCDLAVSEGTSYSGIKFVGSGGGIFDCQISGVGYSISLSNNLNVVLQRNQLLSPGYCIYSDSERFEAEDNIFESTGSVATIDLYTWGTSHTIRHNHILRGTGPAVRVVGHHGDPDYVLDMRENWWGTTERDSIAAWIHDGNDVVFPPLECTVAFEPFADGPLPTEKKSLGGFKAMFK